MLLLLSFSQLIMFPIELSFAVLVFAIPFQKRKPFLLQLCLAILANLGIIFLICIFDTIYGIQNINIFIGYGGWCLFVFLGMCIAVLITCQASWQESLYCVTCAYLTEHIVYCIRILINAGTNSNLADTKTFTYYFLHIIVYVLAYYIFAKRLNTNHHYTTGIIHSLGLLLSALSVVVVMSLVASLYRFTLFHGMYGLFCCIFVLSSQVAQTKQIKLQKELDFKEQLWIKHKTQYEMSKENVDLINFKCHDLKHHINALRNNHNLMGSNAVFDSIEDAIMNYEAVLHTGNDILDTLLTEKELLCKQHGIAMTCMIDGKSLSFMDPVDLYTLFGNAFDNAMEALLTLPNKENYCIHIMAYERANMIFIQIENPYSFVPEMKDGIPQTSKSNTNYHGFGLKSIIHTAEKYDGVVHLEMEYHVFVLRIIIPSKNKLTTTDNAIYATKIAK